MAHTYTEFYYHLVWGTRQREPYLVGCAEEMAHRCIRARCQEMGVFVYALGGMPDHVHLVCAVPPRLAVAEAVARVKGASSHLVNAQHDVASALYWHAGYGGLTFSRRDLPRVVPYVENQRRHHATNRLWSSLERLGDDATDQEGSQG